MNQIIYELKVAKGTVYHYFTSKEALLTAVVEDIVEAYIDSIKIQMQSSIGETWSHPRGKWYAHTSKSSFSPSLFYPPTT